MAEGGQNKHLHWKKGCNQTHYFLKSLITFPCFWHLQTAWRREKFCGRDVLAKPDSTCWSSSSLGSKSELKKKNPIPGETTKTCTSKNETEPQHKWRRQTQGRVRALPKGTCWKLQFFHRKTLLTSSLHDCFQKHGFLLSGFSCRNFCKLLSR